MNEQQKNLIWIGASIVLLALGASDFVFLGGFVRPALTVILGVLLCIIAVPKLQVAMRSKSETKGPLELENDCRQTIVQIFGGAALLVTIYAAFDNAKIARQSIVQSTQSYELARHGQISDRILKGMEMLSKERNMDAKVASIHVLEQVAIEDPLSEWLITETLSDYLRLHSRWPAQRGKNVQIAPDDVGTIFVFLRRRPWSVTEGRTINCIEYHQCMNYQRGQLPNRDHPDYLKTINLPGVDLRYAYLNRVMLKKVILNRAHLEHVRLRYAHLENSYAEDAYFNDADLRDSFFNLANLRNAHL